MNPVRLIDCLEPSTSSGGCGTLGPPWACPHERIFVLVLVLLILPSQVLVTTVTSLLVKS